MKPADSSSISSSHEPADKPLRIAVIGPRGVPSNYSGVERIVEELFEYIAAQGHKVTVYCRPGVIDTPTGSHKGMRLVRTPAPGGKTSRRSAILFSARCTRCFAGTYTIFAKNSI